MTLEDFNSQLLGLIERYYQGPFHQKLLTALNTPNWDQDLGKACSLMFKMSSEEIAMPTPEMITTYGMGNIGNDYLINLFIDDRIGRIIDAFRKMDTKNGPKFEVAAPFINDLSFLEVIPRRATEDKERLRPLFYMRLIYDFLKAPVLRKPNREITFPVDDSESLAFLGISALLNGFLADKISQFYLDPRGGDFNLFGIGPYTSAEKPWLTSSRYFPIANTQGRDELKNNILLSNFIDFNSRSIAQTKHALPLSLSHLLSSSSFIWDKEIFGIDPMRIEAMTEEERLKLLFHNKNGIIEKCFEYLEPHVVRARVLSNITVSHSAEKARDELFQLKMQALRTGNQIESSLKEIESMRHVLYHTSLAKKETRSSIKEIAENFGKDNDTQFEADLLALLEKSPVENLPEAAGLEKVVFDLSKKYRREILLEAAYKEKITEENEKLKLLKDELAATYQATSNDYLDALLKNEGSANAFLQVHAIFSYFIFNKDLFPQRSSLAKLAKKSAAQKIAGIFGRAQKRENLGKAFKALKGQELKGTIQDLLNDRTEQIFAKFKGYQERGVRALTPGEIESITKISRAIDDKPEDLEKFERLEKVLEHILVEDEAFSKNCQDLSRVLSTDKIVKLQTHMNACLLFTEGQNAADATGMERSIGFKKLHQAILKAMEGDSIELKALRSGEKILDQLEAFEYPPEVLKSFEENISSVYRTVPLDLIRDFEVNIEPLNIDNFPQVKQKRLVLDEIKKKIIEKAPRGDSSFLSQKHRPPRTWNERTEVFAGPAIDNLFGEGPAYTKKYLEKNFGRAAFYYGTLLKSLKTFASRERLETNIFAPGILKKAFGYMSQEEIDLAILVGIYEEIRKDYLAQIENLERLHITELVRKQSPGSKTTRASVFDGTTLFRYYKTQSKVFLQNQETAEQLYELFLPLFLTSYLSDAANLQYGSSFFVERKLDTIKKFLPGVERIYGELDAFMISKGQKLAELGAFFREKQHEQDFLEEGFLDKLKDMVNEIVSGPVMMIGESALAAAVIGIGIMSYTGSPHLAVIGGMAISAFWMTKGKVFVKDVFALAKETIKSLFGVGYSPWSLNNYILDIFKVALQTEVKLSQSDRQGQLELQHLFSNAIFLQEEFSIMRNSRYSLLEFKNRLHMLLPNALENVNFSTMLLNLFFKFNEPLFLSMPPDLLKNAQDPHFQEAVKEYGLTYEQKINQETQKFLAEGHHEEECDLTIGANSPFRDYLVDKAKEGALNLTFSHNSKVHQFLSSQNFNLENMLHIPIEESQIVPIRSFYPGNIEALLKTLNEGLKISDQFLGAIRPVFLRTRKIITPTKSYLDAFDQGLKSSYFLLRYSIDTARRLNNFSSSGVSSSSADTWLESTNETGQSIFLSPLFRESFSMLMKTAELSASSGISEGQAALRVLVYVQGIVDRYLRYGTLTVIPLKRFEELEQSIVSLLEKAQDNPQIIFPIIFERERNQNIELPFAIWSLGQKALAEELGQNDTAVALRNANQSNITYLSNQSIELFFTSDGTRGFALSPMIMNILENALHYQTSQGTLQFLGVINERDQARLQMVHEPARSIPDIAEMRRSIAMNMARRRGQPLALPALQGSQVLQPFGVEPAAEEQLSSEQGVYEQAPEAASSSSQGTPISQGMLPQGQNAQIPGAPQAQNLQQPSQTQQTPMPVQSQQQTPAQETTYMPIMQMPADQMATQGVMPITQETQASPERNVVMVGADGRNGTTSGGAQGAYDRLADRGERYAQMPPRDVPPIGPAPNRPYRGPMNMGDFANHQAALNQAQGFPYGKVAAIGGGLMLGAAVLSQLMKDDEKKRKRS